MKTTVNKVMSLRDASITGWQESILKSRIVQRHVIHEPYSEEQKREANEFKKPLLRYNVMVSKLMGIEGQEHANRRAVYFEAHNSGDSNLVNAIQDNWEFLNNTEGLSYKLIRAMVDGIMYPHMGWLRRRIVLDDYGFLTFKWDNIDTFSVNPDPSMINLDMSDCRFVAIDEWLTKSEINMKYKPRVFKDTELELEWNGIADRQGDNYSGSYQCIDGDRYLVVQLEEKVASKVNACEVNGEYITLTDSEIAELEKKEIKVDVIRETIEDRVKVTTVMPSHNMVLQEQDLPYNSKRLSYFPCSSYDWAMEKRMQPSMMYILTDVQDAISKSKSQHIDFLTQQLVENYAVAASESEAIKAIKESRGQPFRVIPYRNINNRVPRETGSQNAGALSAIQNDIYMSLDFIAEISNITQALEGRGGKSGESAQLFESKVSRGLVSTNPYYEIKAKTNLNIAKDYLELLPDVYFEDDRPLLGQNTTTGKISHNIVNFEYNNVTYNDVRKAKLLAQLDNGDNTQSKLQATFQENLATVQLLLNGGLPPEVIPWEVIIKNSNIRDKDLWIQAMLEAKGIMEMNSINRMANENMQSMPTQQPMEG